MLLNEPQGKYLLVAEGTTVISHKIHKITSSSLAHVRTVP